MRPFSFAALAALLPAEAVHSAASRASRARHIHRQSKRETHTKNAKPPFLPRRRYFRAALTSKARGELAESLFTSECLRRGYVVAKPYGDNQPFDFLVIARGRISRVQVKSCWSPMASGAFQFRAACGNPHSPQWRYTSSRIDFLAGYVAPLDRWLIIPVRDLRHVRQFIFTLGPRCRARPFLDAWTLLEPGPTSALRRLHTADSRPPTADRQSQARTPPHPVPAPWTGGAGLQPGESCTA